MQKATVTFENEDKTKKAIVSIEYEVLTNQSKIGVEFIPVIKAEEEPEFYARVASSYMRDLSGEQ